MNALIHKIVGNPTTWIVFYFFVIMPIWSWRISRAYIKFKNSTPQDEQKFCRHFVGEILCYVPLLAALLYLIFRVAGF